MSILQLNGGIEMIETVEKYTCMGCKACGDNCPTGAISFSVDKRGFWYPVVDLNKCIQCNKCLNHCAVYSNNSLLYRQSYVNTPNVWKAIAKEEEIRMNSTSGGIYYLLAETYLKSDGYIVGCAYSDDYKSAKHIVCDGYDGLLKIYGSKYFQSDTEHIYLRIKKMLENEKKVLFCGTPCQVGALYSFLKKHYTNLTTIDFICRGINSPKAYRAFIEELENKYGSKVQYVHFKSKKKGWDNLSTEIKFENGKLYLRDKDCDPWVNGYINGNLYIRPSCENCKFKNIPKYADITLGDFWGENFTANEKKKGVSVVLTNSKRGAQLLEEIKDKTIIESKTLEQVVTGNPAINQCVQLNKNMDLFFEEIEIDVFSKVVWRLLGWSSPKWQLRYIKKKIWKLLGISK